VSVRRAFRWWDVSRGHGRVQRAVLECVEGRSLESGFPAWVSVDDLCRYVHDDEPTDAQRVSMRRAVRVLADAGDVQVVTGRVGEVERERHFQFSGTFRCRGADCFACAKRSAWPSMISGPFTGTWDEHLPDVRGDFFARDSADRHAKNGRAWHYGTYPAVETLTVPIHGLKVARPMTPEQAAEFDAWAHQTRSILRGLPHGQPWLRWDRACDQCGGTYKAAARRSRFCSGSCRAKAHRRKREWRMETEQ
jgi:ferredoxin